MRWHALLAGDIEEALRQADIVEAIRGPQPPSPLALKLIDRFNRMAAENARFKALDQRATQVSKLAAAALNGELEQGLVASSMAA